MANLSDLMNNGNFDSLFHRLGFSDSQKWALLSLLWDIQSDKIPKSKAAVELVWLLWPTATRIQKIANTNRGSLWKWKQNEQDEVAKESIEELLDLAQQIEAMKSNTPSWPGKRG